MDRKIKSSSVFSVLILVFLLLSLPKSNAQSVKESNEESCRICTNNNYNKLVVIWSSDDPMVAKRIALMYPHAAKRNQWFDEVILVIWGPSAKLISEDVELQNKLEQMKKDGIAIKACIACANEYNVADRLKALGYDVVPMGEPLTEYLKAGYKVLTF